MEQKLNKFHLILFILEVILSQKLRLKCSKIQHFHCLRAVFWINCFQFDGTELSRILAKGISASIITFENGCFSLLTERPKTNIMLSWRSWNCSFSQSTYVYLYAFVTIILEFNYAKHTNDLISICFCFCAQSYRDSRKTHTQQHPYLFNNYAITKCISHFACVVCCNSVCVLLPFTHRNHVIF